MTTWNIKSGPASPAVLENNWFRFGRIVLTQSWLVRSTAFNSPIGNFVGKIVPGLLYEFAPDKWTLAPYPFQFSDGRSFVRTPRPQIISVQPGHGFAGVSGTINIQVAGLPASGAVTSFSFTGVSESGDPDGLLVESTTELQSGELAQPWSRHVTVFTPPRGACYLGIGGVFTGMPTTTLDRYQHIKQVQVEVLPLSNGQTPTAYSQPREITTLINAERINWSTNPGLVRGTQNWTGVTRSHRIAEESKWSAQVQIPANTVVTPTHTIPLLVAGRPYVVSVLMYSQGGATNVGLDADALVRSRMEYVATAGHEVVSRILITPTTTGPVTISFTATTTGSPVTLQLYDVLVEEGTDFNRQFFDGYTDPTSGDYVWETGEVPGASRSFYYKNLRERLAVVKRILKDNVPMGVGIAEPKFGSIPIL